MPKMDQSNSDSDSKSSASYAASVVSTGTSTSSPTYLNGYTPTPWYRFTLRTYILVALPILSLLGAYGTMVLSESNGTFKSLLALISSAEPKFPGTLDPLVKEYTGIEKVDKQLTVLVTFFAPVVDARSGALRLFSVFGLGQFGGAWTLMVLESLRMGNLGRIVSWVGTFGFLFQNITFTITTPIWLFLHLLTSPVAKLFPGTHANSVLLVSTLDLRILPLSIILSYWVPSILMVLPSPEQVSPKMHQYYIALWQPFPVWTIMIHFVLRSFARSITSHFVADETSTVANPLGASYLSNVKHVYRFVLALCMFTHLPILFLTLIPSTTFKDITPILARLPDHTFAEVFIPYFPSTSHRVSSLAEGVITFLQWDIYIGSMAFLLWAILLYRNATTEKMIVDPHTSLPKYRELLLGAKLQDGKLWRKMVLKIGIWGLLAGPIGAVAVLLGERDKIVRQKVKQGI